VVGVDDERVRRVGRAELGDHVGGHLPLEHPAQRALAPAGQVLPDPGRRDGRRRAPERPAAAQDGRATRGADRVQHAQRREVRAVHELVLDDDAPRAGRAEALRDPRRRLGLAGRAGQAIEVGERRHVGVQRVLGKWGRHRPQRTATCDG
jgi:hypothetical protein